MTLPIAILAGGLGTRLGPLTADRPKILVEVAGRPFVFHQLDLLRASGIRDVVFCVGHQGDQIVGAVEDGHAFGMRVRYSHDGPIALGTGGAIHRALPLLGPVFFVLYGDSYLRCDYTAMAKSFARFANDCDGMMAVLRNRNRWDRSNIHFADHRIVEYDKLSPKANMDYIDYGISIFKREAIAAYPAEAAFDLGEVCGALARTGRLAGYEATQRFYEIGSPAGLADTAALLTARARDDDH